MYRPALKQFAFEYSSPVNNNVLLYEYASGKLSSDLLWC
jgi:hypothetical protein